MTMLPDRGGMWSSPSPLLMRRFSSALFSAILPVSQRASPGGLSSDRYKNRKLWIRERVPSNMEDLNSYQLHSSKDRRQPQSAVQLRMSASSPYYVAVEAYMIVAEEPSSVRQALVCLVKLLPSEHAWFGEESVCYVLLSSQDRNVAFLLSATHLSRVVSCMIMKPLLDLPPLATGDWPSNQYRWSERCTGKSRGSNQQSILMFRVIEELDANEPGRVSNWSSTEPRR